MTESAIQLHLSQAPGNADERFASLQSTLKCGTNCGSCVPELKRLAQAAVPVVPLRQAA